MRKVVVRDFRYLNGEIEIPSDKSLSHRGVIFSSLAKGRSIIRNFSDGKDPLSTINVLRGAGVKIEFIDEKTLSVCSSGKFQPPVYDLDCGNSGTTMRLMSGVLAGQNFKSVLCGDLSLSKRPMKRVIEPLTLMGAKITSSAGTAPLIIQGGDLHSINYTSQIASAQVKSCILLAGMQAEGRTIFSEPYLSRNHTEILLKYMGADIKTDGNTVSIEKSELAPVDMTICGDISSAAYFIAAALIIPKSRLVLKNIGLNPTRTGILDVIKEMGGNIRILDERIVCGEPVGDIMVEYSSLKGCKISGGIIPRLIDEIPVIAVIASFAGGYTIISDAQDLRNKESDRIKSVVEGLKKMGADIEETDDGMIISGKSELKGGCCLDTFHDHRLAMSFYVAGLAAQKEVMIDGFEWAGISFPNFENLFEKVKVI